jgi:protein-tyrosine phosphatase
MFKILFVCTGNRCRSPLAEASFRDACKSDWIEIASAGTLHWEDLPPPPEMIGAAESVGVDISKQRSRYLGNADPAGVDLLLGMSLEHGATASVEYRTDRSKAFMLLEFLRLSTGQAKSEDEARAMVAKADERRASSTNFFPGDKIADPMGGPESAYFDAARIIDEACRELARRLCDEE